MTEPSPTVKVVEGLRVFFRTLAPDGTLHYQDIPLVEAIDEDRFNDLLILLDKEGTTIMYLNPDAVAFILPAKFEVSNAKS